jgi:CHAT domain-containing protein
MMQSVPFRIIGAASLRGTPSRRHGEAISRGRKRYRRHPSNVRLLIAAAVVGIATVIPVIAAAQARSATTDSPAAKLLPATGGVLRESLRGGDYRDYRVNLDLDEYVRVAVVQRGIDVVVSFVDDRGEVVGRVDRWSDPQGEESLSLIAARSGPYTFRVESLKPEAGAGSYTLNVTAGRRATSADVLRVGAERAYAAADDMNRETTSEGRARVIAALDRALDLWNAVGDPLWQATTLVYLGVKHYELGNIEEALDRYRRSLPLWRLAKDVGGEAAALSNIAGTHQAVTEYQAAIDFQLQALSLARRAQEHVWVAHILHSIALSYLRLGDLDTALRYGNEALAVVARFSDNEERAHVYNEVAGIHLARGDAAPASRFVGLALPLTRNVRGRLAEATALTHLGTVKLLTNDYVAAGDAYERALSIRAAAGHVAGQVDSHYRLGVVHAATGDLDKAEAAFHRSLEFGRLLGNEQAQAFAWLQIARTARRQVQISEALAAIEQAVALAESLRVTVADATLRSMYFAGFHDIYAEHVLLLMGTASSRSMSPSVIRAGFELSERARARALLDSLSAARAEIADAASPDLLRRQRDASRRLALSYSRLDRATAESAVDARRDHAETEAAYNAVETALRASSPRYAQLVNGAPVASDDVQRSLDQTSRLVEYLLTDEGSFVWVVGADGIHSATLPARRIIETLAARFHRLISTPPPSASAGSAAARARDSEINRLGRELSTLLLSPIKEYLSGGTLLIVADGGLEYLPFAALQSPFVETPKYHPLAADREIVRLPSASVLAFMRTTRRDRPPAREVLVIADPVFERDDPRVAGGTSVRSLPSAETGDLRRALQAFPQAMQARLPRLLFTRAEADAIFAHAEPQRSARHLDFDANLQTALSPVMSDYRFIHFATHSLLNLEHPELSGIVLSRVTRTGALQNGFLQMRDVYKLRLRADLVVLSACHTAIGREIKGEGIVGIARAFIFAGASSVAASSWAVNDVATSILMQEFYRYVLRENRTFPAALRAAQTMLLHNPRWSDPYYWAAFSLYGPDYVQ